MMVREVLLIRLVDVMGDCAAVEEEDHYDDREEDDYEF